MKGKNKLSSWDTTSESYWVTENISLSSKFQMVITEQILELSKKNISHLKVPYEGHLAS